MKARLFSACMVCLVTLALGAGATEIRLAGIVAFSTNKLALLEATGRETPAFRLDLGCKDTVAPEDLAKAIEQALAPKGILFRQDGDKFVPASRENDFNNITPGLRELAENLARTRTGTAPATEQERLPDGSINFPATDLSQALQIYQELSLQVTQSYNPFAAAD